MGDKNDGWLSDEEEMEIVANIAEELNFEENGMDMDLKEVKGVVVTFTDGDRIQSIATGVSDIHELLITTKRSIHKALSTPEAFCRFYKLIKKYSEDED
ncbi:MAG: hypothetical protein ACOC5T_07400 [Elusimicrobiota bacterium]